MKRILLIVPLLCIACAGRAADVKFAWDYVDPMPNGFEMRIMDSAGAVILTQDCGASPGKECLVKSIPPGERRAQCYAYQNGTGSIREYSDGSNIVQFSVPVKPTTPADVKIK